MAKQPELSDIERAWLMSVDGLLITATPKAHALAAGRIFELWGVGGIAFREELARRADAWRRHHEQLRLMVTDQSGACQHLIRLLDVPNGSHHKNQQTSPKPKSKGPNRPVVRPSRRQQSPTRKITDEEAAKFLEMIETEGISVVFDPGMSIINGNVFHPPLIVLDRVGVFYEQIAPAYERGEIKRPWDPVERDPAIALAFDLALLVMLREKKWTWVICDRHFVRLPWGHHCKVTPQGRPGWKLITAMLKDAGFFELRGGQTWRLTKLGKAAAEQARERWRSNIDR